MEQIHEYLLKNGWVRGVVTHGEMTAASTNNIDKWFADFESRKLKPVSGFDEIKDGKVKYLEEILTMMPIKKRARQLDKVMVDGTNVRENLLKHGWFVVSAERLDIFGASVHPSNQSQRREEGKLGFGMNANCNESHQLDNMQEPKGDVEKLLDLMASQKKPKKSGKCRGSEEMVKFQEKLLKLGWLKKDAAASDGNSVADTSLEDTDKITKLDRWFKDFEDKRNQTIQTMKYAVPTAVNKDIEKLLDMFSSKKSSLQAYPNHEPLDKLKFRESLLANGWYAAPNNKLPGLAANADALDKRESEAKSTENVQIKAVQQRIGQLNEHQEEFTNKSYIEHVLNMVGGKKPQEEVANQKGKVDKEQLKKSLLTKNWYTMGMKTMSSIDLSAEKPNLLEDFSRTSEEIKCIINTPRQADINYSDNEIDKNFNDVATKSHEKSSKKTRHHKATINSLQQQSWPVNEKNRHQTTVVRVPESTYKNDDSTAYKPVTIKRDTSRDSIKQDRFYNPRQSRRDIFEAQKKSKITSLEREAPVTGVSHKKTLFARFIRRSRKLMGRFFKCGRKEE
ncbi:hypothetical protein LOTGIDRAFT_163040 [Lottia gigantea]|uniref:Uncharacterized protein n=1 Tax=Lottia gigantea TaxID=225164 RepID=V4AAD4_LOTGI|nr:hypothetical protein LOTGIDRAFT_163040 [Lottia gigantea]ESO92035.1 hypothetical protein LOTGIDRAFT_163040 [Lottia gigantea]